MPILIGEKQLNIEEVVEEQPEINTSAKKRQSPEKTAAQNIDLFVERQSSHADFIKEQEVPAYFYRKKTSAKIMQVKKRYDQEKQREKALDGVKFYPKSN